MLRSFTVFLFFTILCSTTPQFAVGQPNAHILGNLKNTSFHKEIELLVDQRYLSNDLSVYKSTIAADGHFAFTADVAEAMLVTLVYQNQKTLLYLEPNDTLIIDGNGHALNALRFSGKGGINNTLLHHYLSENPQELNLFKMTQYRHGIHRFRAAPDIDRTMLNNPREAFESHMLMWKTNALALIDMQLANKTEASGLFKEFIISEILYNYAYHMLFYGNVYKNRYRLSDDYYQFLNEIPLQSEHIGNFWYRQFLQAYFNHLQMQQNSSSTYPYRDQFELTSKMLIDKPLAYMQSELIVKAFRAKHINEIMEHYWDFSKTNPYVEFEEKVVNAYQKAMMYAVGTNAPGFRLEDNQGRKVSLESYRGQVVLLNFWASWCRPCIKKMRVIQGIQGDLERKGLVFINISLDRDPATWKGTIDAMNLDGVHLLADENGSGSVVRDYNVKVLPQYFVIDRQGRFAEKPSSFEINVLKYELNKMLANSSGSY